jgi:CCR4-NOT transcription complex subunit 2
MFYLFNVKSSCAFLLQSSLNSSASNLPDSSGRSFATSFSGQSGAASPVFHHSGG